MDLNTIHDDWEGLSPKLAAVEMKNPFSVPEGYFDELPGRLNRLAMLEELKADTADIFTVPEGYFENLPDYIEGRLFVSRLGGHAKADGFTLPEHYFENLRQRISSRAGVKQTVKVRRIQSWIHYAAAACITIAIGTGIFINHQRNSVEAQLSRIPEEEIINYLELHSDVGDTPVIIENLNSAALSDVGEEVSKEDLKQYLDSTL